MGKQNSNILDCYLMRSEKTWHMNILNNCNRSMQTIVVGNHQFIKKIEHGYICFYGEDKLCVFVENTDR